MRPGFHSQVRTGFYWERLYAALFAAIAVLTALSPWLRAGAVLTDFDRIADALTVLLCLVRIAELPRFPLARRGLGTVLLLMLIFAVFYSVNGQMGSRFNTTLFLIDGKLLLFMIAILLFQNRPFRDPALAKAVAILCVGAFAAGTMLFVALWPGVRLRLLNESNYTVLSFCLLLCALYQLFDLRNDNLKWLLVILAALAINLIAQSRTGFAIVLTIFLVTQWRRFSLLQHLVLSVLLTLALLLFGEEILTVLTRGEFEIGDVDRVVFLREFLDSVWSAPPLHILFGNHIGLYVTDAPRYMQWWVQKLSWQQGVPFGLAPFQFHTLYLRLFADLGLVVGLLVIWSVTRIIAASAGRLITAILLIAGLSMSVFYLSAVLPYLLLTLMICRTARQSRLAVPTVGNSAVGSPALARKQPA